MDVYQLEINFVEKMDVFFKNIFKNSWLLIDICTVVWYKLSPKGNTKNESHQIDLRESRNALRDPDPRCWKYLQSRCDDEYPSSRYIKL